MQHVSNISVLIYDFGKSAALKERVSGVTIFFPMIFKQLAVCAVF